MRRFKGQQHQKWGGGGGEVRIDWQMLSALYFQMNFSSSVETLRVCCLWMSQAASPRLLHLVPPTAATIHLYPVADAPNHSIHPLIYLNATPLEYSLCPSRHSVDPSLRSCLPPSPHPRVRLSMHPSAHSSRHPRGRSSTHPSARPPVCPSVNPSVKPSDLEQTDACAMRSDTSNDAALTSDVTSWLKVRCYF